MTTANLSEETRFLIGIDASRSVSPQPTGTEFYSRYLIEALLACAPDRFSFRLYFNQPPQSAIGTQSEHSAIRVIPCPRLWTHLRLSAEIALHRPDLLFVPAHVLPIIHPRRSVVTVHDLGYLYFPEAHPPGQRWYLDTTTRWQARTAAHLLADSAATKRDLIEKYHADPVKITVAYPGLAPSIKRVADPNEIARVKARYHIDGGYLLYLGTIQPRKNLARLIEAFGRQPTASGRLLLAGKPGWYSDQLLQHANDRVKFIGYVDAADKNALLSGATAFVFPSLYEGFGFPVLEAMACGVPVLCSNTSSLPEVAGDAALLVNPLDVDDIARGLQDITTSEELRRRLIERGPQQAQKFTWRACADVVLNVFEKMLSPSPRPSPFPCPRSGGTAGRQGEGGSPITMPPTPNSQLPTSISILGIPVHDVTTEETLALVDQFVHEKTPHQICTVNPEFIMMAQRDVEFKRILDQSALNLPDGVGVVWAARRVGHPLRERVAGSDLVGLIADRAQRTGWRIFLLGAAEGVAKQAAIILRERYPQANIVGAYAGSPRLEEEADITARVRSSGADVLLVAYGAPRQDKWIDRNVQQTGVAVAIGIGGSLDFIVGKQKRAPQWLQRIGLEWLYRLIREPWRWRRQLALPRFVWAVLRRK